MELVEPVVPLEPEPTPPPSQLTGTAAPQAEVAPVDTRRALASRTALIAGVLIALIALGLIVWALLAGMPFGHRTASGRLEQTESAQPDVVTEQQSGSGTVSQIGEPGGMQSTETTATTATMMDPTMTMPSTTSMPPTTSVPPMTMPPGTSTPPMTVPPVPTPTETAPPATRGRPITEDEATNIVRGYVTANNYYATTTDCVGVVPMDHENGGYTIDVVDRCGDRGRLGRWRVDEATREIFVRKADGRYLRP